MSEVEPILNVYSIGETTVVGFGGRDVLDAFNIAAYRDEMLELIKKSQCKILAFDLTGVKLIPSGMLGFLNSIRQYEVEVHLYNPSADVREVLETTNLDKLIPIFEVPVTPPTRGAEHGS